MAFRKTFVIAFLIMGLFSFLFGCSRQNAAQSSANRFPSDENGDVLKRMLEQGDDLSKPRDINYSFVFATEENARAFTNQVQTTTGLKTELSRYEERKMWDTTVTKNMIPTHQDVTALEQSLTRLAEPYGGEADGWGCFVVKKK
jgi:hypothetical protein